MDSRAPAWRRGAAGWPAVTGSLEGNQGFVLLLSTSVSSFWLLSFCDFVLLCFCTFALCFWTSVSPTLGRNGLGHAPTGLESGRRIGSGRAPQTGLCRALMSFGQLPFGGHMHRRTFHIPRRCCRAGHAASNLQAIEISTRNAVGPGLEVPRHHRSLATNRFKAPSTPANVSVGLEVGQRPALQLVMTTWRLKLCPRAIAA